LISATSRKAWVRCWPRRIPASPQGNFPLPPPAEDLSPIAEVFPQLDDAALQSALAKIVDGTPGKKPVPFGRYLFLTLLGPELWRKIDRAAGDQPIELVLAWDSAQTALHRLPWEMMRGEETFLAEDPQIAVARQITDATAGLAQLASPPSVLIVIGTVCGMM
jgi:hypothetical protein